MRKEDILPRLPGWSKGEILVKLGCTSDLDGRLSSFNDHPLARIFGLKLSKVAQRFVGEEAAREEEDALLASALSVGRPAADEYTEFYFVSKEAYHSLLTHFTTVKRVA